MYCSLRRRLHLSERGWGVRFTFEFLPGLPVSVRIVLSGALSFFDPVKAEPVLAAAGNQQRTALCRGEVEAQLPDRHPRNMLTGL